jgi:glycosyltransferase involved in cell wall biosynthesis
MLDNEFPPLGGGTGVVNYHVLTELTAYPDVWVDLVTSSRSRATYETERFSQRITLYKAPVNNKNIHHATVQELLRYSWRGVRQCWRLLERHRYDLSFAFAGVPAGAMSYLLKVWNGLPYLVSLQGPDVPGFEDRYNALYPILKPLLRQIWRNASAVIAITSEQERMARRTLSSLDTVIIPNGVDTHLFSPAEQFQGAQPINILCVGRLIERKGQQHLLEAFAQLRTRATAPLHLTLVGAGDAEGELRQRAARLGLAHDVTFTGVVSRERMPDVYRAAHIFVLPSQNECFSIALLEALASGLPIVVTQPATGTRFFRPEANGLIVPWADVPALTDALSTLVHNEPLRQTMGRNNRELAHRFSWPTITRQYLDLCLQISTSRIRQPLPSSKQTLRMADK